MDIIKHVKGSNIQSSEELVQKLTGENKKKQKTYE